MIQNLIHLIYAAKDKNMNNYYKFKFKDVNKTKLDNFLEIH